MKTEENNKELNSFLPAETAANNGGFSTPENYFQILENNIQEKVSRIPVLYTTKSENPFAVPGQYFTELENSVREKISLTIEREASSPLYLRPSFVRVFVMLFVIAACTVTFIVLNRKGHSVSEKDISFNDIYHSTYVTDLDENELAGLIEDSTALNSNTSQFENYLIEENTDIYTLTEEL